MSKGKRPSKRITTKAVQATEDKPFTLPTVPVKPDVDTDGFGNDGLTIRQRLFVEALIGPAGGNATKAAEMAGYASENRNALWVTASENLRKPKVQEAIAHAYARLKDTPEWARASLVDLASSSMANFVTVDEAGNTTLDMAKAAEAGALGQIKEFREESLKVPGGEAETIKRTIKLHDRTPAIGMLLKLHGKLVERMELTGKDGGAIETKQIPDDDHLRTVWRRCMAGRADRGVQADPSPDRN